MRITSFHREMKAAGRNLGRASTAVKKRPLLALTTDFGSEDPYVGIMKGVILGICPDAVVVDVTHGVPPQDVVAAQLTLEAARAFFSPGTVHVAVVDPGVGTERRAVAVFTRRDVFLAPDNGLLSFLEQGEILEVRSIENGRLFLHPVSRTFHGRDVFAPVAARIAAGLSPAELGPTLDSLVRLDLPRAEVRGHEVLGPILAFDHFGNAVTAIRGSDLPIRATTAHVKGVELLLVDAYGGVPEGAPLALIGSSGRVEISVRGSNARAVLGLERGDEVIVGTQFS